MGKESRWHGGHIPRKKEKTQNHGRARLGEEEAREEARVVSPRGVAEEAASKCGCAAVACFASLVVLGCIGAPLSVQRKVLSLEISPQRCIRAGMLTVYQCAMIVVFCC